MDVGRMSKKNFLLLEHGEGNCLQIVGIINDKTVHVHINEDRVHYYEDTEEHLEVKITKGLT